MRLCAYDYCTFNRVYRQEVLLPPCCGLYSFNIFGTHAAFFCRPETATAVYELSSGVTTAAASPPAGGSPAERMTSGRRAHAQDAFRARRANEAQWRAKQRVAWLAGWSLRACSEAVGGFGGAPPSRLLPRRLSRGAAGATDVAPAARPRGLAGLCYPLPPPRNGNKNKIRTNNLSHISDSKLLGLHSLSNLVVIRDTQRAF
jgi:hypothetical protein